MTVDNSILEMLSSSNEDHDDGPTRTQNALECARRVLLSEQLPDNEALILAPHNEQRNVGTLVHKLAWAHHTGVDPELYVPLRSDNEEINVLLNGPRKKSCGAWRIFNDYAEEFPLGFWGDLVGAELKMESHMYEGDGPRRTGIADAIWNMNEPAVHRVQDYFEIELNGPGVYVWDLKTGTSLSSDLLADHEWRVQPSQYLWLARAMGYDPRGMIICKAVGYKPEGKPTAFQACCIPDNDEMALQRWEGQVEVALNQLADSAVDHSHRACNAWFRECPHKASGACEGV